MNNIPVKPKRIVYVTDSLGAGGAERQLVYLLSQLDRRRYDPVVVTLYNTDTLPYHYDRELDALNVPILSLNGSPRKNPILHLAAAVFRYVRLCWRLRPDIVQGRLHTANLVVRLGRPFYKRHKVITSVRSLYTPNQLRTERHTAFLSDYIVTVGDHIATHLIDNAGLSPKKVRSIDNGVDIDRFAANPQPDLRRARFPEATFLATMVARIDPRKDHALLLEALHLLRDRLPDGFRVLFLGNVSNQETQNNLDKMILDYDLGHWVIQMPAVTDISAYYHASDITLLTSYSEAFPNVLMESLAAGTPAIASSVANAARIVAHGVTGWEFPSKDAAALAACLETALNLPSDALRQLGENARQAAMRYSLRQMAERYMALYEG